MPHLCKVESFATTSGEGIWSFCSLDDGGKKPLMLNPGVLWESKKNIVTLLVSYVDVYSFKPKEGRLSRVFSCGLRSVSTNLAFN